MPKSSARSLRLFVVFGSQFNPATSANIGFEAKRLAGNADSQTGAQIRSITDRARLLLRKRHTQQATQRNKSQFVRAPSDRTEEPSKKLAQILKWVIINCPFIAAADLCPASCRLLQTNRLALLSLGGGGGGSRLGSSSRIIATLALQTDAAIGQQKTSGRHNESPKRSAQFEAPSETMINLNKFTQRARARSLISLQWIQFNSVCLWPTLIPCFDRPTDSRRSIFAQRKSRCCN